MKIKLKRRKEKKKLPWKKFKNKKNSS
jgi:hypothetical protein